MVQRLDDADANALGALARIYAETSQWRELIDILTRQAETTYEPAAVLALRARIAEIWEQQLGDAESAVDANRDVLSIDPTYRPALQALERLFAQLDLWNDYVDVLGQRLALTTDRAEKAKIYFAQALVQEKQFDDIDAAVGSLNQVLFDDPKNIEAITELERIYSDQERYVDLVEIYDRHVAAVDDPEAKTAVLVSMARTYAETMDDAPRAIEIYRRVVEIDSAHPVALERLAALYESTENYAEAVKILDRLGETAFEPARRVQYRFHSGEIYEAAIGDFARAEACYKAALELDGNFAAGYQALQRVYMNEGRWTDAIDALQSQIALTRDMRERATLLVNVGLINEQNLGNTAAAQRLYEEAIELDPENIYAAEPLADMYLNEQRWERARPLLDLLINSSDYQTDETGLVALYDSLGRASSELGDDETAQGAWEQVLSMHPSHVSATLGLAGIYRRGGRLDDAYALYLDVLSAQRDALGAERVAKICIDAGNIKRELGQLDRARDMFERALAAQPSNEPALRELVSIVEASGDASAIVSAKERLLGVATEPLERIKLLEDVGDAHKQLGDLNSAEKSYTAAIRIDPARKGVLVKLLEVFSSTGNWRRAVEVLGQLARLEENDPKRQAVRFFAIGTIFREELGEAEQAVEFFNKALDSSPMTLEPFQAVDELLTQQKDWKKLEQNYRKMIGRIAKEAGEAADNLRFLLVRNLAEIYRSRMNDPEQAIAALKVATQMRPDNAEVQEQLADLFVRTGAPASEVIGVHQRLIQASPFRFDSYRALFRAYLEQREFDRAWCIAAALTLLQQASAEESEFYKKYLPANITQAQRPLSADQWRVLHHPDLDSSISSILALLASNLREDYALDIKRWNVNRRKDRIDLAQETPITGMIRYSMQALQVAEPQLYEKVDYTGLCNANTDPVGLIVGGDMKSGRPIRDVAFIASKAVAMLRPEYYLGSAYPSTDSLKIFLFAALTAVTGQPVGDAPAEHVQSYVTAIRRLPDPVLVQLRNHVQAFLGAGRNLDLSLWLRAVDHGANRVGLLLCGDLKHAISCIQTEAMPIGKADIKEKVRELVLFSISDQYFQLRRDLGLALQAKS
jgi:tetratricopeptide (TPR) repeat protein